jgi:hypothetical protein
MKTRATVGAIVLLLSMASPSAAARLAGKYHQHRRRRYSESQSQRETHNNPSGLH